MTLATTARRRSAAVLLGAALVVLGATACDPKGASVSTSAKPTSAAAATAPASSAAKPSSTAKVGDTISLKGTDKGDTADVTVVKVVDNPEGADEFTKPADGKRFVAVQFRIKATGSKAYSDAPQNSAKLLDTQGQAYAASVSETKAGPSFQVPASIAAGESALGFITFEVPTDARIEKAQFALDSGFADQTGQWKLV
jgi:hypothetical protein